MAQAALAAGKQALTEYSCAKSPHKFTQPQLFALLVLKQFFKLDYRGVTQYLARWAELRSVLGLRKVPHFRTLHEASKRLLKKGAHSVCWTPPSTWPASAA